MKWRWVVTRSRATKRWWALSPDASNADGQPFRSHADAFAYAYARAAQDAELDGFTADLAAWDEANVNDALRRRP